MVMITTIESSFGQPILLLLGDNTLLHSLPWVLFSLYLSPPPASNLMMVFLGARMMLVMFNFCSDAEADMETIDTGSMLTLLMPIVMLIRWMLIVDTNAGHGKTDARTDLADAD